MNRILKRNRLCLALLGVSAVFLVVAIALRVGLGATDNETRDSAGRTMGFNDPLSPEHYWIMVRNFRPTALLDWEYAYVWTLFAMHLLGARLLLSASQTNRRATRWFFLSQACLFPFGWLALPFSPLLWGKIFFGQMDREGFVDIPFFVCTAQPVWLLVSMAIVGLLPGESLGLKTIARSLLDRGGKMLLRLASRLAIPVGKK